MAGKIKEIIDQIVEERSRGNRALAATARTKLLLKGIDPERYTRDSEDDPAVLQRLHEIARDLNILR